MFKIRVSKLSIHVHYIASHTQLVISVLFFWDFIFSESSITSFTSLSYKMSSLFEIE